MTIETDDNAGQAGADSNSNNTAGGDTSALDDIVENAYKSGAASRPDTDNAGGSDGDAEGGDAGDAGSASGDAGDGGDQGDEGGEGGEGGESEPWGAGAPETYEPFQLADGFTLEGERLEDVHKFATAKGFSQDQAQQMVDAYVEFQSSEAGRQHNAMEAMQEEYRKSATTHPVIGADLENHIERANEVLGNKRYEGLLKAIKNHGMQNNPDVVMVLSDLRNFIGEDDAGGGEPGATTDTTPRRYKLYPDLRRPE